MAAEFSKWVIVATVLALPLGSAAHDDGSSHAKEIEGMLSRDLAAATAVLGQRIEACEEKATLREVPILEQEKLAALSANRELLLTALGHLHFHNSFQCERAAREAVAFQLGMLEMVHNELGKKTTTSRQVREGLVYPSVEQLRYRQKFEELPEQLRLYLENEVGQQPFDLMTMLEKNRLLKDY